MDVRKNFLDSNLDNLYNPLTMPSELVKAHQKLDKLVEKSYGKTFDNDTQRVIHLFELYNKLISPLYIEKKKKKVR